MATGQSSPTRHLRRSRAMTETCSARTVMLLQKLDTVCASPVKWTRVTDRPHRPVNSASFLLPHGLTSASRIGIQIPHCEVSCFRRRPARSGTCAGA